MSKRTTHRSVRERWIVTGTLVLDTPAHFGSGEDDDASDMALLLDEISDAPLLPGTSIAGALRNYLREIELGDGVPFPQRRKDVKRKDDKELEKELERERGLKTTLLFGSYRGDDDNEGAQSPLVVHDSVGVASAVTLRDGVAIDGKTRTAADDKKFDIQLLSAGTTFPLRFELIVGNPPKSDDDPSEYRARLLQGLATALHGLSSGEITLGARKRRGFGQCHVKTWSVQQYDLTSTSKTGLLQWLVSERKKPAEWYDAAPVRQDKDICRALDKNVQLMARKNAQRVTLEAEFALDGAIMIRSGFGAADENPDMVHLHAYHADSAERVPVIPGTSWAGVMRHRAIQIGRTLAPNGVDKPIKELVNDLFGPEKVEKDSVNARASRISIAESAIINGQSLVQTRVKIDRFTGGAAESALFEEEPVYGDDNTTVKLTLTIRPPAPDWLLEAHQAQVDGAEVGLLLLLLKDLWTGDLRIGGEASVGRGRLRGKHAILTVGDVVWQIAATQNGLNITGDPAQLQAFVSEFNKRMVQV